MPGYITIRPTDEAFPRITFNTIPAVEPPKIEVLQGVVGGLIAPLFTVDSPLTDNEITGYVNDEGICLNLPVMANVKMSGQTYPFCGNMVITGLTRDGRTCLLSDAELDLLNRQWRTIYATLNLDF